MKELNKLAAEIHKGNVERGFYDEPHELGTYLMLTTSELAECLEAHRKGHSANIKDVVELTENFDKTKFEKTVKNTIHDEIADTFIRLMDLVGFMGLDLETHVDLKLKYNATRGHKHGKKY